MEKYRIIFTTNPHYNFEEKEFKVEKKNTFQFLKNNLKEIVLFEHHAPSKKEHKYGKIDGKNFISPKDTGSPWGEENLNKKKIYLPKENECLYYKIMFKFSEEQSELEVETLINEIEGDDKYLLVSLNQKEPSDGYLSHFEAKAVFKQNQNPLKVQNKCIEILAEGLESCIIEEEEYIKKRNEKETWRAPSPIKTLITG